MINYDPLIGVLKIDGDRTLLDIWFRIHAHAASWVYLSGSEADKNKSLYDQEDLELVEALQEIAADCWSPLCTAVGWTVYGAVALSWCEGAELDQVWEGWVASGFPLKPLPEFERPAWFINPALMPKTSKLSEIVAAFNTRYSDNLAHYTLAISAAIVAAEGPLEFDMSHESLARAQPQIAAFLKSRMLQQESRTAEDDVLIEMWSDRIKGTEFDIWEGS